MTTLEFKMTQLQWMREMIFRYAWMWMLGLSLAAVAGLVLGITVDLRWLVCALMVICLIIPSFLLVMYYYFGLRREAFANTVRHTLTPTDTGLIVTLKLDEETEREEFFEYTDMLPMQIGPNSVTIPLKSPAKGFIWIPAHAFENTSDLESTLQEIDKKIIS